MSTQRGSNRAWPRRIAMATIVAVMTAGFAGLANPARAEGFRRFSITDTTVVEGSGGTVVNAVVTVTLDAPAPVATSVGFTSVNGSATSPSDYAYTSGTLSFPSGTTSKTVSIPIVGDDRAEGTEYFYVNLFSPIDAGIVDSQAQVNIIDDERTPFFSVGSTLVNEGDSGTVSAIVPVNLTAPQAATTKVRYYTSNSSATSPSDFAYQQGTLTFAPGITTQNITVLVNGDTNVENDEDFYVNLYSPVGAAIMPGAQGRIYIRNDDRSGYLSVGDARVTEGNSGSVNAAFTVSLSPALTHPVTVVAYTSDGTATVAGNDYTPVSTLVTFPAGSTTQTVNVPVLGDTLDEGASEYFYLNLTSPSGASNPVGDFGTGLIVDDDPSLSVVAPTISIDENTILEGSAGNTNLVMNVRLSNAAAGTVTVNYATSDGTATAASGDYTATSNTVTFTAGQVLRTLSIPVKGDTLLEGDEYFYVNLSSPVGATISDGSAAGYIANDDFAPGITTTEGGVVEGDSSTKNLAFTVNLTAPSPNTVTATASTSDNNAVAPGDYAATTVPLTFLPGETTKTVNVPVNGDTTLEGDESFGLNLSSLNNAFGLDTQAYGSISNDDFPGILSVADVSVFEGNTGTSPAKFTVKLSSPSPNTVQVSYQTIDSTATAGSDYTAVSGTLVFPPGTTSQTVTVNVTGDSAQESDEQFYLYLSSPVNAGVADPYSFATILNDDAAPYVSVDDVQVNEGNTGTTNAVFTVYLSGPSLQTVQVNYATSDGSATVADGDYLAKSGTLTFNPGVTTQAVSVAVNGDVKPEGNESFYLNLGTPVNTILGDSSALGIIVNDDAVSYFSINDATVVEGNSGTKQMSFNVTLTPALGVASTVNWYTSDSNATAGSDYVGVPSTVLNFPAGTTTVPVSVTINGDVTNEPDEGFYVNLSSASAGTAIVRSLGAGVIQDDDPDKVGNWLTVAPVVVDEGNSGTTNASFTVRLFPAASSTVTVTYFTQDGSASSDAGQDYQSRTGTLTFPAGTTTQVVNVPVNGDLVDENDEYFYLTLNGAIGATIYCCGIGQGQAMIRDDDTAPWVTVRDTSVVEGTVSNRTVNVPVSLTAPATQMTTLSYTTADGSAVADNDYTPDAGTLVFLPGEQTKIVTLTVLGDALNEGDEYFYLNLSDLVNVQNADVSGTVYIRDLDTFNIAGKATDDTGAALSGVGIQITSATQPTINLVTSATGTFTSPDLPNGNYTITPSKSGLVFLPASTTVTIKGLAVGGQIFIGLAPNAIGGRVTDAAGTPVSGATVTRTGNAQASVAVTSNAQGYWGVSGSAAGTYTLTATKASTTFNPAGYTVNATASGSLSNDFVALTGVTITGRVFNTNGTTGLANVTVTRTGGGQPSVAVKTNSQGYYGFSNVVGTVAGTTYTLTPTLSGATFTPVSQTALVTSTTGASGKNFTKN